MTNYEWMSKTNVKDYLSYGQCKRIMELAIKPKPAQPKDWASLIIELWNIKPYALYLYEYLQHRARND